MYRKKSRGWYKHKDFILIDLACLFMALILAYLIRNGSVRNLFTLGIYRNVMIFVILVDLFLIILFESYKGVLRRGRYQELRSVIRQMILIELASGLYLFTVSGGHTFSRIILYLMGIFYVLLSYCTRIIWKKHLLHKMAEGGEHSLYIVTNYDLASKVIQNVKEHNYNRYNINGLILIDKDMTGKEIAGVQVVADLNNAPSFICQQWVDEVFVNVDETYPYPQELIEELLEMGMPVHVNLAKVRSTPGQKQFVEAIGGYTVLTTTMNYATDRQALAKRVLDILGGLVGCFLTGIIFIFIAPAIYISSPGPIFFSQTRIGKNGKPFKMYKFRSMYMDAEERKAELMAQNKMSDGRMFKLDFDPRVIGNKILPDGTRKTGIGEFIRKTSLDEFPQFWNVLNGSMSLVGTRPILQDELRQYELHHRARIAIKPGITGMWQVSGRSDITDFEEVVRLDTEYISNWNFGLDIKILFKTVIMVLNGRSSTLFDEFMICMSSVPSRIREGMVLLSGDVLLLFNPLEDENEVQECFRIIQSEVLEATIKSLAYNEQARIVTDHHTVRLPLRVNWGGGWSDTPPYCNEKGGTVLNAAILLNGEKPVEVTLERIPEQKVVFDSRDMDVHGEFDTIEPLQATGDPYDPFALQKACLLACGIIPREGHTLGEILERLGSGFVMHSEVTNVPKGSGLGTSSILSAACVKAVFEFMGIAYTEEDLYAHVLAMEQIMSTGGGWQDQVGGITPGLKYITSMPGLQQQLQVAHIELSPQTKKELDERFVLIYTGQRRLARNLLRDVVGRYVGNEPDSLFALEEIQKTAALMRFELERGNVDGFAKLLDYHWELSKKIDAGSSNTLIEQIFSSIEELVDGKLVCGAGGGGFLQVILKKGVTRQMVEERLKEVFMDSLVGVADCNLVWE